jgi:hypothetical protein
MRSPLLALAALAVLASPTSADARRLSGEAELARETEGRVAGEPVECIDARRFSSSRIIEGTAIVYEAPGGTLWVNVPRGGGRLLSDWDVLVTRQHSTRLCRGDLVRLFDRASLTQTGSVLLGDFVPYRRPGSR